MTGRTAAVLAAVASALAGATADADPFERSLTLQRITFRVACPNDSPRPTLTVTPSGLAADNSPVTKEVDGRVVGAEVADLNADGSPEIYVYVQSRGSGAHGSLAAWSANNGRSLSEVFLPELADDPRAAQGYQGRDELRVAGRELVRRFPVYRDGDANARPTGGTREIRYVLAHGEASWVLRIGKVLTR